MITIGFNSIPSAKCFAQLCFEKFKSLPKTGKPNTSIEWTVLSCIIQYNKMTNNSKVVALGTGTKCIGSDQLCAQGLILNDSHAEIIARRAFLRYIYDQVLNDHDCIFKYKNTSKRFILNENISFHFFSTYVPCGDACIDRAKQTIKNGLMPLSLTSKISEADSNKSCIKTSDVFTGAKLICTNKIDIMDQEEGAVRTKPGKGIPTLSVSCSDKLSKWNILGIQGALLDSVLEEPIYLNSFTFYTSTNIKSISRALYERWFQKLSSSFENSRFHIHKPEIRCLSDLLLPPEFIASDKKEPSPCSMVWCACDVNQKLLEIAVAGKRLGITKKSWNKKSSSLRITKSIILEKFKHLLKCYEDILKSRFGWNEEELEAKTYKDIKSSCDQYQSTWEIVKKDVMGVWTVKPKNLNDFT